MPGRGHLDLRVLGRALIGRALYLPADWAAREERRELAGVPDEVMFATKPQLVGEVCGFFAKEQAGIVTSGLPEWNKDPGLLGWLTSL